MHYKECRLIINSKRANEAIDKAKGVAKVRERSDRRAGRSRRRKARREEEVDWGVLLVLLPAEKRRSSRNLGKIYSMLRLPDKLILIISFGISWSSNWYQMTTAENET